MNVDLLQQIKAHILAEPDDFQMDFWVCGSACCIAGRALALAGTPIVNPEAGIWDQQTAQGEKPSKAAARLLGLSMEEDANDSTEATRLFYESHWPDEFFHRYVRATDRAERAQIAADRIDHFIATDGRA